MQALLESLWLDKAAIGISALCVVHCLAMPLALVALPALASLPVADEHFHLALVFVVIPTSMIALTLGCRRHQRWHVAAWGGVGVVILTVAAVLGHDLLGEMAEKTLTVIGEGHH